MQLLSIYLNNELKKQDQTALICKPIIVGQANALSWQRGSTI